MYIFVVLFALLGAAFAQVPKPCMSPKQWEGRYNALDFQTKAYYLHRVIYDELNHRMVFFEESFSANATNFFYYIFLFDFDVVYSINKVTKQCTKAVPVEFRPIGISPNATFESQYSIGGARDNVVVHQWSDRVPNRQVTSLVKVFTVADCFPVKEIFMIGGDELFHADVRSYYDIVLGISDPNVFIPPRECENAPFDKETQQRLYNRGLMW